MIKKLAVVFSLALFFLANAEETDADIDLDARRARNDGVCDCPPPNEDIVCKHNQKKEKFFSDDVCKCPKFRCIWEVCPKVKDVKCEKCEVKVEVDDCGCKQFECQAKVPMHCPLKAVVCDKCSKLEQSKDECGCPEDKCVPRKNPPSQCPCKECETCKKVDTGPQGCGLKEEICVPVECPPFEEKVCDRDCEKPAFIKSKCGCTSMKCEPLKNQTIIPECGKCEEPKKKIVQKCGLEKYECGPRRCAVPPAGQEECYDVNREKLDECQCPIITKKKCSLVPAGDCPKGTVAQGGFDVCGCPHQICVPCKNVYDQIKPCKKCEKSELRPVANGQCQEAVCVPTPECNCPQGEPKECGVCEEVGKVKISEHCEVNACVKSKSQKCVCKELMTKKSCGKCERVKPVKSGECKGVRTCSPMSTEDCPKMGSPSCPPCQKADVVSDECGCKKYVCKKKPCAPLARDMIKCADNRHKKQPTVGLNACKCQVQTCVDKDKVCEDLLRTTLAPQK